jgi:hypothetical protein
MARLALVAAARTCKDDATRDYHRAMARPAAHRLIPLLLFVVATPAAAQRPSWIVDKPITWNEEREQLTREYRAAHYGEKSATSEIDPTIIVVHHTAIDTLKDSFKAFDGVRLKSRKKLLAASALNVSAHFLVDRDGTVYQLMPTTRMARHVIGLNWTAIGIENVGGNKRELTGEQIRANAKLVRHLKREHPRITTLIAHSEYQRFRQSSLWKERDTLYITAKRDPAPSVMEGIRRRVDGLGLGAWPADVSPVTKFLKGGPRLYTKEELRGRSLRELALLRNEVFARHGYTFHTAWLAAYFSKQRWYARNPRYSDELLTDRDRENISRVLAAESAIDVGRLRILRNTVFARHGRVFKSEDLREHFAKQPWYKPDPSYSDARLTPEDRVEIQLIQERESGAKTVSSLADWSPDHRVDEAALLARAREEGSVYDIHMFYLRVAAQLSLDGFAEVPCPEWSPPGWDAALCSAWQKGQRKRRALSKVDRQTLGVVEKALALAHLYNDSHAQSSYVDHRDPCGCVVVTGVEVDESEALPASVLRDKRYKRCVRQCEKRMKAEGDAAATRFKAQERQILKGKHARGAELANRPMAFISAA